MTVKEIETLESYFKTQNEHWNSFVFKMLCEVLKQGNFENPETPLQLFGTGVSLFIEKHKTPLQAVEELAAEAEALTPAQKLFVYEWLCKYLRDSEFDFDLSEIANLLKSQTDKLKEQTEGGKPLTGGLREALKQLMQNEIETLADTLKELEPAQRLNIVCKLIPFVLPKVESITHTEGEPQTGNFWGRF